MAEDNWRELEYQALREELTKLMDICHATVRFCLPAAAAVYALPILVKQTGEVYLWSLCAALGGLLITAMVHTFCACITGGRRIGAYIKEAIEPNTNGGLRWETTIFEWETHDKQAALGPLLAVSAGSLLANVVAAAGAGAVFLRGFASLVPPVVAVIFVFLSLPIAFRTSRPSSGREQCVADVRAILAARPIRVESAISGSPSAATIGITAAPMPQGAELKTTGQSVRP